MTDEAGVQWIPNSNFFLNRNGSQARYVILHGTAGGTSAAAIGNYFASTQNTNNPVSSHYIIGTAGEIVQAVAEKDGAWGNGALTAGHDAFWDAYPGVNPNNITISIEHCKASTDNSDTLTPAQQATSFKLISDICHRWKIPMRPADSNGGITGHFSLDPVSRSDCPGTYPWAALWSYLGGSQSTTQTQEEDMPTVIELDTPGVGQFWAASANGAWRCTAAGHNHLMLGNIRSFYVRFGNQGLNGVTYLGLPITDMWSPKSGTYAQAFERGIVVDDTNRVIDHAVGLPSTEHCYLAHLDSGFGQALLAQPVALPLQNQIKSLAAQLADAQKNGGDPARIAQLQAQITSLQGEVTSTTTKIQQAVALLSK